MNDFGLPVAISALACAIAERIPDPEALALLGIAITQLGDTLSTLAAQRELYDKNT